MINLLKKVFVSKENKAKQSCCDMEFVETQEQEDVSVNTVAQTKEEGQ